MLRAALIAAFALSLPAVAGAQLRAIDELPSAYDVDSDGPTTVEVTVDALVEAADALRGLDRAGEGDEPVADRTPVHIVPNRRIHVTYDDGSESTYCLQNGQYVMCG